LEAVAADRTVTTRVLRERVLALSWGSALLLHVAEPRIAQGVAEHSVFLNNPRRRVARLYSTANTMLDLLVGGPDDVQAAAARINAIHDRVHGSLQESHPGLPEGTPYSAHDPALLSWVHIALHVTLLKAYAALVGPMSLADQDRYCTEVASIEPLLGIPVDTLPRDARTLRQAFDARLPRLSVGEHALQIARGILAPDMPLWGLPLRRMARLCTIGFLPPPVRRAYRFRWRLREELLLRASLRVSRRSLLRLPTSVSWAPPELMLRWTDGTRKDRPAVSV
jgi:uncharacterized protein (DUF2236 family)